MAGHQLAPQRQRVLAGRVRDLVDEALEVDGVLVQVDAAPEAGRHRRVAHRVVDQQRRERVADRRFRPRRIEALERRRVLAVLDVLRRDAGQDRLARDAHVQPGDVALRVEARGQLALGDRVIAAVRHVLLARPDQLDRRAGHLLGDGDRPGAPSRGPRRAGRSRRPAAACRPRTWPAAGRRPRPPRPARPRRSASASRPRSARASSAPSRSSSPSSRGSGAGTNRPPRSCAARPRWRRARRRPGCRPTASSASSPAFITSANAALDALALGP